MTLVVVLGVDGAAGSIAYLGSKFQSFGIKVEGGEPPRNRPRLGEPAGEAGVAAFEAAKPDRTK